MTGIFGCCSQQTHVHECSEDDVSIVSAHEGLVSGSVAATPRMMQHESWNAVVDNYVYVHNAFRNDLQAMIAEAEAGVDVRVRFATWKEALEVHSRIEDELFLPALVARIGEGVLPKGLTDTDSSAHRAIDALVAAVVQAGPGEQRTALLELQKALLPHLEEEEREVMPKMLAAFTTRELWALDSFIVNEKLGYCPKDQLIRITKWWFSNMTTSECWGLLKNFVRAGMQPEMPAEDWLRLQASIPALKDRPLEEIMP